MLRPLLAVPLLVATAGGVWLARDALARWRDLRVAQTYELAADRRPMLVRAAGAALCGAFVGVLAVLTVLGIVGGRAAGPPPLEEARAAGGSRQAAPPPSESAPVAVAPAAAAPAPTPVVTRFASIGHPAGGDLQEAEVAGRDGHPHKVRVWLPAEYGKDPAARFPVIVLHGASPRKTADTEVPDVFDGVASAVQLGRSRAFIVVAPEGPSGTAHPCDLLAAAPLASADDDALRAAVSATFRTVPAGPAGWGALGVDGGAPCAAAVALARPDLYGAAAAVSGRYDTAALARAGAEAPAGTAPRLLLAAAKADTAGLDAVHKLQAALHAGTGQAARADVRTSEIVQDYTADLQRVRLVRVAVQYLAEALAPPS
ncbi:hypothetical protein [Kitasatospora sp. NBC_00315]|uniref:hypothetical protein n=1 Tax=Kitasatospora sp. NBC_00315 TaxID=2975963 RepID=UPI003247FB61